MHCRSGGRSQKACAIMRDLGHPSVVNVRGGILEWEAEGFFVEKHKGFHLSLIRQVHLTAGFLVVLGVTLSFLLHPNWALLSGVVGAGLLFSGLSGWCGMAELFARMPWNQE